MKINFTYEDVKAHGQNIPEKDSVGVIAVRTKQGYIEAYRKHVKVQISVQPQRKIIQVKTKMKEI